MASFEQVFGAAPSARASAPGRVNLLGEHTDYNDGLVLPSAIGLATTVSAAPAAGKRFRVYSEGLDELAEFTLEGAPAERFARYVYGCLKEFAALGADVPPLDLHIASTLPMGAGLSSSAALEVAVLRVLRTLYGASLDDVALAGLAHRAEVGYAGVHCGIMDQMASSLSTPGSMLFLDTRSLAREVLPLPADSEILVMHCGIARSLQQTGYNLRRDECHEAARQLGLGSLRDAAPEAAERLPAPLSQRVRHVLDENARVLAARGADAAEFGALMNASHQSLRDNFQVSVAALDHLVEQLQREPDVHGAKLTGAGFGGACVALCRAGRLPAVVASVLVRNLDFPPPRVLLP